MLSTLGKMVSRRHNEIIFLFFSHGDNLQEMSNPLLWNKKNITNMLSAELAKRVVKVNS